MILGSWVVADRTVTYEFRRNGTLTVSGVATGSGSYSIQGSRITGTMRGNTFGLTFDYRLNAQFDAAAGTISGTLTTMGVDYPLFLTRR